MAIRAPSELINREQFMAFMAQIYNHGSLAHIYNQWTEKGTQPMKMSAALAAVKVSSASGRSIRVAMNWRLLSWRKCQNKDLSRVWNLISCQGVTKEKVAVLLVFNVPSWDDPWCRNHHRVDEQLCPHRDSVEHWTDFYICGNFIILLK